MIEAYVTAVESDTYLANYPDWLALDPSVQDTHLSWGRVWIDSEYLCPYTPADATDDLKNANSLAGYQDFKGYLFLDGPLVESTSVKAGSVESSKTYASGYRAVDPMLLQAEALLKSACAKAFGGNSVSLGRN